MDQLLVSQLVFRNDDALLYLAELALLYAWMNGADTVQWFLSCGGISLVTGSL